MANQYRKVTVIKLKQGGELQVELDEGMRVREAKAKGTGSVWLKKYNNRMLDVAMIGDIEDKTIEVPQTMLYDTQENKKLKEGYIEPASATSSGYITFLVAQRKFAKKYGTRPFKLTPEQEKLVLERESKNL